MKLRKVMACMERFQLLLNVSFIWHDDLERSKYMKKMISILLAAICVMPVSACGSAAAASQLRETGVETMNAAPPSSDVTAFTDVPEKARDDSEKNGEATGGKTLVAYFSATGTTRTLAGYAAEALGADIYEIVPEQPYTQEDLAYYTDGRADREQSNPLARPVISGSALDMSRYHVIILGYPIWHGQAPKIISTFLESYDFTGKTIVPFCTSHSSGIGSSDTDLHALAAGADWLSGRRFAGGTSKRCDRGVGPRP